MQIIILSKVSIKVSDKNLRAKLTACGPKYFSDAGFFCSFQCLNSRQVNIIDPGNE